MADCTLADYTLACTHAAMRDRLWSAASTGRGPLAKKWAGGRTAAFATTNSRPGTDKFSALPIELSAAIMNALDKPGKLAMRCANGASLQVVNQVCPELFSQKVLTAWADGTYDVRPEVYGYFARSMKRFNISKAVPPPNFTESLYVFVYNHAERIARLLEMADQLEELQISHQLFLFKPDDAPTEQWFRIPPLSRLRTIVLFDDFGARAKIGQYPSPPDDVGFVCKRFVVNRELLPLALCGQLTRFKIVATGADYETSVGICSTGDIGFNLFDAYNLVRLTGSTLKTLCLGGGDGEDLANATMLDTAFRCNFPRLTCLELALGKSVEVGHLSGLLETKWRQLKSLSIIGEPARSHEYSEDGIEEVIERVVAYFERLEELHLEFFELDSFNFFLFEKPAVRRVKMLDINHAPVSHCDAMTFVCMGRETSGGASQYVRYFDPRLSITNKDLEACDVSAEISSNLNDFYLERSGSEAEMDASFLQIDLAEVLLWFSESYAKLLFFNCNYLVFSHAAYVYLQSHWQQAPAGIREYLGPFVESTTLYDQETQGFAPT